MLDAHHTALASGKDDPDVDGGTDHDQDIHDVIGSVLDLLDLDTFGCDDDLSSQRPSTDDHASRHISHLVSEPRDLSGEDTVSQNTNVEPLDASEYASTPYNNINHDDHRDAHHSEITQSLGDGNEPERTDNLNSIGLTPHLPETDHEAEPISRDEFEPEPLAPEDASSHKDHFESNDPTSDMDLDLEAAIGNAFASFGGAAGFDVKGTDSDQVLEHHLLPNEHPGDDMINDSVIGVEATLVEPSPASPGTSLREEADSTDAHVAITSPTMSDESEKETRSFPANSGEQPAHTSPGIAVSEPEKGEQSLEQDLSAAFDTAFEQAMKSMSQSVSQSVSQSMSPKATDAGENAPDTVSQQAKHTPNEGYAHANSSELKIAENSRNVHSEASHEKLDAAIVDTINSAGVPNDSPQPSTDQPHPASGQQSDDALNQTIESIFGSFLDEPKERKVSDASFVAENTEHEHADLDAAIGDAFKSVMGPKSEPLPLQSNEDLNLEAAIAEAFSSINTDASLNVAFNTIEPASRTTPSGVPLPFSSLTSSMSPYVKGILEKSELKDKEHAQEHAIQVLAKQIKFNFQEKASDETASRGTLLDTAISNSDQGGSAVEDTDLEELKMNEILLKAFNMAMENPEELILDLDVDMGFVHNKEASGVHQSSSSVGGLLRDNKAPLSNRFFDSSTATGPMRSPDTGHQRSTSIAETLAMHRSSRNPSKNMLEPPTTQEGSSLLNSPLGIRISQAMSAVVANNSNSYREISESSILSVIRRMNSMGPYASALGGSALPELSLAGSTTVSEILESLRNKPERSSVQRALVDAQTILQRDKGSNHLKVCSILDSLFHKIGPAPSPHSSSTVAQDSIQFYSDSIISTMASFDRFAKDKPATDSEGSVQRDNGLSRRVCNRERKKRWREGNTERNKDIDLRMRVTRRATAIHGEEDTPKKREWIENEFASRRQKRILRNGIEDDSDKLDSNARKNEDSIESDPRLLVPINSLFNLLVKLTETETPEIVLTAISSSTAAAAAAYAKEKKLEFRTVNSAVTMLIANLMELNEHHQRVSAIARNLSNSLRTGNASAAPTLLKSHDPTESHLFSRITQTIKDIASGPLEGPTQKRPYPAMAAPPKRSKVESEAERIRSSNINTTTLYNQTSFDRSISDPNDATPLHSQAASGYNTSAWIPGSIKMPQYKPREAAEGAAAVPAPSPVGAAPRIYRPSLSLPTSSPFLSNKALGAQSSFKPGLRKPGSFQRPQSMKHEIPDEHRVAGIPTLNATSQ